jgi:hypothetical protein
VQTVFILVTYSKLLEGQHAHTGSTLFGSRTNAVVEMYVLTCPFIYYHLNGLPLSVLPPSVLSALTEDGFY